MAVGLVNGTNVTLDNKNRIPTMPFTQKLLCEHCSAKFHVFIAKDQTNFQKAYELKCPDCNKEILFRGGFGTFVKKIPKDGIVAHKI